MHIWERGILEQTSRGSDIFMISSCSITKKKRPSDIVISFSWGYDNMPLTDCPVQKCSCMSKFPCVFLVGNALSC